MVTVTPGITAPVGSVILPKIRPALPCENSGTQRRSIRHTRGMRTKTKKAVRDSRKRPKKNLNSIEASGLRDGIAPRCHHACDYQQKSGGPQLHTCLYPFCVEGPYTTVIL